MYSVQLCFDNFESFEFVFGDFKFYCLPGCSVADLEEAVKLGLDSVPNNLDKVVVASCKTHGVTWSSAPSSALPVIVEVAPLMIELLKKCPNGAVPGKKLDQALLAVHKSKPLSTSAVWDLSSAEDLSQYLRQLMSKVRRCKEAVLLLGP